MQFNLRTLSYDHLNKINVCKQHNNEETKNLIHNLALFKVGAESNSEPRHMVVTLYKIQQMFLIFLTQR